MSMSIVAGLLIPFLGTTAGAACVFFLKKQIGGNIQRIFTGFAAGVMVAASVWSLLIPAMDMCEEMGKIAFLPAMVGFLIGIVFLLFIDSLVPHLHVGSEAPEGHKSSLNRTAMLMLAVTIHNFPEGAAVSVPLRREGYSRKKSFLIGQASGLVEPVAGVIGALLVVYVEAILPYALSFAAGAMILVAVHELIPECQRNQKAQPYLATMGIVFGFALMMLLDVMLG